MTKILPTVGRVVWFTHNSTALLPTQPISPTGPCTNTGERCRRDGGVKSNFLTLSWLSCKREGGVISQVTVKTLQSAVQ